MDVQSEMVERMAEAMDIAGKTYIQAYEAAPHTGSGSDPFYIGWADVPMQVFARAAIEAMKKPTPGMVEAAIEADHNAQFERGLGLGFGGIYRAMLSAALSPALKEQERT